MTGSGEQFAHLSSGIDLCYETFGDPTAPPILLVMGLGGPMGWWSTEFCEQLAERGHFVIRYDNRDTGRSTKLREKAVTRGAVIQAFLGRGTAPYGIADLAEDAFGLLDELGLSRAHLVGVSMGGMIVQTMAIARPERVSSLVSIMSTTGRRTVGWQNPKVYPGLLAGAGRTREEYIARAKKTAALIASPAFPTTPEAARRRAEETYDRGWIASGVLRHMLAVVTQPDRTALLGTLTMPATVIHGTNDPLVHRSGGRATAAAIPGARHVEIAGMAHDIPEQLYTTIIDEISTTVSRAQTV